MATEERAVDGLKTRINRGEFNKYIFFLAANLVDLLEMEYNPGTEIKPQPPEMKMSAMDLVPCRRQGRGGQTRGLHARDV